LFLLIKPSLALFSPNWPIHREIRTTGALTRSSSTELSTGNVDKHRFSPRVGHLSAKAGNELARRAKLGLVLAARRQYPSAPALKA
jgi:hypothetical protein